MISFTLALALIPYGIILVLFALLASYSVYHLVRHGATTGTSFLATFAFLTGATFVLFFTWQALAGTDWGQQIDFAPSLNSLSAPRTGPSSL